MNKTILISGGTSGIGKGAVFTMLSEGNRVVTFSRNQEKVNVLSAELAAKFDPANFIVMQGDTSSEDDIRRITEETRNRFGPIDVLVNNAAIGFFKEADQFDSGEFMKMLNVNLLGYALLVKYCLQGMKEKKSGLIINVSSVRGRVAQAMGEFYSATKFGVMGYSEGLREELRPFGIKVATLCPGMIDTEFFDQQEIERRKALNNGVMPPMLTVEDMNRIFSLVINQSQQAEIRDIFVMPFQSV